MLMPIKKVASQLSKAMQAEIDSRGELINGIVLQKCKNGTLTKDNYQQYHQQLVKQMIHDKMDEIKTIAQTKFTIPEFIYADMLDTNLNAFRSIFEGTGLSILEFLDMGQLVLTVNETKIEIPLRKLDKTSSFGDNNSRGKNSKFNKKKNNNNNKFKKK